VPHPLIADRTPSPSPAPRPPLPPGYDTVERLKHGVAASDARLAGARRGLLAAKAVCCNPRAAGRVQARARAGGGGGPQGPGAGAQRSVPNSTPVPLPSPLRALPPTLQTYDEGLARQRALSKEAALLLQRKSGWGPGDVARFTEVYAAEHETEGAVAAAKARWAGGRLWGRALRGAGGPAGARLHGPRMAAAAHKHPAARARDTAASYEAAGAEVEAAQAELMQRIRERYTQVGRVGAGRWGWVVN
jgi:hypothetical protein